jgi:lipopolysaccharide transport system permease protein
MDSMSIAQLERASGKTLSQERIQSPTIVIQPTQGWSSLGLRDVWEYRELLFFFLWRDIKGKYRQMALGPLWIIIKPALAMIVFSLVFGELARLPSDDLPYPIFSYAALLPWSFFSSAVSQATYSLVSNMHVISKVYFPRIIVPISGVISGLVDFGISFLVLVGMMLFYGIAPTLAALTLPFFLLLAVTTALAVGLWVASLAVKFHDVRFAVNFALQAWMYASPVVYPTNLVPERWRFFYRLNPMVNVVDGFRWALLGQGQIDSAALAISSLVVAFALISGAYYFRRTERTVVDWL